MFQSAPLTDVRGDTDKTGSLLPERLFQSAPLTDVRGDEDDLREIQRINEVSIRSPHGCKGRFMCNIDAFRVIPVSIRSPHGCKGRFITR